MLELDDAKGREFDHVFVLGLTAARLPGRDPEPEADGVPDELLKERLRDVGDHEAAMRRRLHVAMTRAREGLVLSWAESGNGSPARPSPFFEEARAAVGAEEEVRGGAVRPRRGPALDVPHHARRAARHRRPTSAAGSARCGWTPASTCRRRWRASSSW